MTKETNMAFTLPELPYSMDALSPHISAETLEYHYGKHHNAYVTNLNKLVEGTPNAEKSLEDIVKSSEGGLSITLLSGQEPQLLLELPITKWWRWQAEPSGAADAINEAFGSFAKFKEEFFKLQRLSSAPGWAWLVKNSSGKLEIVKTANADTPLTTDATPLLTCDVWEHAYYVDYRNARPKYIEAFWNLVNWDFVAKNLG